MREGKRRERTGAERRNEKEEKSTQLNDKMIKRENKGKGKCGRVCCWRCRGGGGSRRAASWPRRDSFGDRRSPTRALDP